MKAENDAQHSDAAGSNWFHMKIYVASYVGEKELAQRLQRKLIALGHEITVDWTAFPGVPTSQRNLRPDEVSEIAVRDLKGVREADVFILLANVTDGRAKYAELGAALMSAEFTSKPKIYVVGKEGDHSVFFFHPAVTRVSDSDALLSTISETDGT